MQYITLHYTTLRYIPVHHITLHYITFTFTFTNKIEILDTINTSVEARLKDAEVRQFFYLKYGTKDLSSLTASWNSTTTGTNTATTCSSCTSNAQHV